MAQGVCLPPNAERHAAQELFTGIIAQMHQDNRFLRFCIQFTQIAEYRFRLPTEAIFVMMEEKEGAYGYDGFFCSSDGSSG